MTSFVYMKNYWLLIGLLFVHWAGFSARAQQLLFTPEKGFSGASKGEGSLQFILGRPRSFHVQSHGQRERDGSFTIRQAVTFQGKKSKSRTWNIRQVQPLRYTGTLTDAAGAVHGHTSGKRLVLAYRVKGPIKVHQTLDLMPDGKTIENTGRITLLGIPVGSLQETIRREN